MPLQIDITSKNHDVAINLRRRECRKLLVQVADDVKSHKMYVEIEIAA
ncbi:MAG: hypothetical protein QM715_09870 [Nibricoccus sp.]